MKKLFALLLTAAMVLSLAACGTSAPAQTLAPAETQASAEAPAPEAPAEGGKTIGFVTFSMQGDFFQALADCYVAQFTADGWEALYADGKMDPLAQIEAAENYIAIGVDVLVLWSVAPEAMNAVVDSAMAAGIKVIAFVAPTDKYDALMVPEDAEIADDSVRMAAAWIDEHFADAEDHSIPTAVFSCRTAETGVVQADEMLRIEEFSAKAKFVTEVECSEETAEYGQAAAENLYTQNPEIQIFLTPHSTTGQGISNFLTGMSSPVSDYTDMAIFTINGDNTCAELIKASLSDETPFRGMVLTGSVADTANEMLYVANGLMDGSVPVGHIQKAGTLVVDGATVDEYLATGTVAAK